MQETELVPYAPDFTPSTLGKTLGEDAVLGWLLDQVTTLGRRDLLQASLVTTCLQHVGGKPSNRRDMASHVIQGLLNYGLVVRGEGEEMALTLAGVTLRKSPPSERDRAFARHILTRCNGMRLVERIREFELRGEEPGLEALAETLDRHATSKNISTMRAWLARAGVFSRGYKLDSKVLRNILGGRTQSILRLTEVELEFLLAARRLASRTGNPILDAAIVANEAETASNVRVPRKSLSQLVGTLEERGFITKAQRQGQGGLRNTVELTLDQVEGADEEIRALANQADAAYLIDDLRPVSELLVKMDFGNGFERGKAGEELAVHLCLLLGLRVRAWRDRQHESEIDLTADRGSALSYQRWNVQVKNTGGDLDIDRVDREVGAAAGTGTTHILFVVPRAGITASARKAIAHRARLTPLHIFMLQRGEFEGAALDHPRLVEALQSQAEAQIEAKRREAERREA